ncbi:serine/threonine protein kinase [Paenibacillus tengchongensis]|uniref:serine/threonine protein kinase n=1 Tax=Paenibacillus tengchongensis TaxID=2608684 RepID=UPI00165297BA|nr:serine/threonine-protein kinase [Paenibacillus tengchongensis]
MVKFQTRLSEGDLFRDRYRIIGLIGTGGMSRVYLAEDLRLPGKHWAIKESRAEPLLSSDVQAEAEMLITLSHPHLPRITDFFPPDSEGYCYLIMDYIEGVTLEEYVKSCTGPLPVQEIIRLTCALLEVLHYLHGRRPPIIYRDLKPGNVMLTKGGHLMLIDFGIARSFKQEGAGDTVKLGTVGFAAPEQYGGGQSGPAADLYGLGALMLYMASGGARSGWQPGLEATLSGGLPRQLIPVIRKLLRHHPEERYPSALEVRTALEALDGLIPPDAGGRSGSGISPGKRPSGPPAAEARRPALVGVLGTAPGLGTTFTSFAVARFLARSGPAAWVERSPEGSVYRRMNRLLEASGQKGDRLCLKGVDLWSRPAADNTAANLPDAYSCTVLDMGTGGYGGALEEFAACDVQVLVASGADWRLEDLLRWLRRAGFQPDSRLRIALPLADHRAEALLETALPGVRIFALPPAEDPFAGNGSLTKAMERMLAGTMGKRRTMLSIRRGSK